MPFMKGANAVRRTVNYMKSGKVVFKNNVKIMAVNYNVPHKASKGTAEFVYWHLGQCQYKNPNVQIVTFKNMTPTPFITLFYDTGERMVIDCDGRNKEEIIEHLHKVGGSETMEVSKPHPLKPDTRMLIGHGAARFCICEVPGQVPCPGWVPLPKEMRGKHKFQKKDVEES